MHSILFAVLSSSWCTCTDCSVCARMQFFFRHSSSIFISLSCYFIQNYENLIRKKLLQKIGFFSSETFQYYSVANIITHDGMIIAYESANILTQHSKQLSLYWMSMKKKAFVCNADVDHKKRHILFFLQRWIIFLFLAKTTFSFKTELDTAKPNPQLLQIPKMKINICYVKKKTKCCFIISRQMTR